MHIRFVAMRNWLAVSDLRLRIIIAADLSAGILYFIILEIQNVKKTIFVNNIECVQLVIVYEILLYNA